MGNPKKKKKKKGMADSIISDKSAADLCLTMGTAEFASEAIVKSLTEVETLFFSVGFDFWFLGFSFLSQMALDSLIWH